MASTVGNKAWNAANVRDFKVSTTAVANAESGRCNESAFILWKRTSSEKDDLEVLENIPRIFIKLQYFRK